MFQGVGQTSQYGYHVAGVYPIVDLLPHFLALNESIGLEYLQMVRDSWAADAKVAGDIAHAHAALLAQQKQYLKPGTVGYC